MKGKNFFSSPRRLFILLLVICLLLMGVSYTSGARLGILKNTVGSIVTPIQKSVNKLGNSIAGIFSTPSDIAALQEENALLKEEVEALSNQVAADKRAIEELDSMRNLLNMQNRFSDYTTVGANIISKSPGNWYDTFIIDKGTRDGISPDMNVIYNNGLVGIVTESYYNHSKVRAIIDDISSVSSMNSKNLDLCLVNGDSKLMDSGLLSIELITTNSNITVGDKLVTSYISSKYFPGIDIGYVNEISYDTNNLTQKATLTPIVDFEHLSQVLIITQLKEDYINETETETQP